MQKQPLFLSLLAGALLLLSSRFYGVAESVTQKTMPVMVVPQSVLSGSSKFATAPTLQWSAALTLFMSYHTYLTAAGFCLFAAGVLVAWCLAGFIRKDFRRKAVAGCMFAGALLLCSRYYALAAMDVQFVGWSSLSFLYRDPLLAITRPLAPWDFISPQNLGPEAFFSLSGATLCCSAGMSLWGRTPLRSMRDSLAIVSVPGVLFIEFLLLGGTQMSAYVTPWAAWTYRGAYILSNWNVLYAALVIGALTYGSLAWSGRMRLPRRVTYVP